MPSWRFRSATEACRRSSPGPGVLYKCVCIVTMQQLCLAVYVFEAHVQVCCRSSPCIVVRLEPTLLLLLPTDCYMCFLAHLDLHSMLTRYPCIKDASCKNGVVSGLCVACRGEMEPILARLKKAEAAAYVSVEAAKGWE